MAHLIHVLLFLTLTVSTLCEPMNRKEIIARIMRRCKSGYRLVDGHCVDIDECVEKSDPCIAKSSGKTECINYGGSYYCRGPDQPLREQSHENVDYDPEEEEEEESQVECLPGYIYNEETGECEDEDECETKSAYCFPGEVCENTIGSYLCNPAECGDDEKADENGECIPRDTCDTGFRFNPIREECEDIDECLEAGESATCKPNELCENTNGSFECKKNKCDPGFKPGKSWFTRNGCVDIDECSENTHNCTSEQLCINLAGSFECNCNIGYTLTRLGTCIADDEYERRFIRSRFNIAKHNFLRNNKICLGEKNEDGTCSCPAGFTMNTTNPEYDECQDIDECSTQDNLCDEGICSNTIGSFMCIKGASCPTGYVKHSRRQNWCSNTRMKSDWCKFRPSYCIAIFGAPTVSLAIVGIGPSVLDDKPIHSVQRLKNLDSYSYHLRDLEPPFDGVFALDGRDLKLLAPLSGNEQIIDLMIDVKNRDVTIHTVMVRVFVQGPVSSESEYVDLLMQLNLHRK